jgi:hypothetical protein
VIGRSLQLDEPAKVLAVAAVALAGLTLPAAASAASHEARTYRGTIVLDQAPVPGTLPTGDSSASYRFHARYTVSGKRVRPFGGKGAQYPLIGRGQQALAYRTNLHFTSGNTTYANVSDWHGSGAWTRRSGNIALLRVTGKRFAFEVALSLTKTIPLAVSSQETDVFVGDDTTCTARRSQSGSTLTATDTCSSDGKVTIPVATTINPDDLLGDTNPVSWICPGTPKWNVRAYNGFCGSAPRSGRIRRTYKTTMLHPIDYPFAPWEDEAAAGDAQAKGGLFYGTQPPWGDLVIRTTFTVDLKPGK